MLLTPDLIKLRLKNLSVGADKYLGQHFLINQDVLDTVRDTVQDLKDDDTELVVEVGPGLGVLTQLLTEEMPQVISIEKDPIFAQALAPFLDKPNLTVIQGDALRILETDLDFPHTDKPWLFIANIPYGITSPLLRMLTGLNNPPKHIVVLMQKEVAERIMAKPGSSDRGLLTVQMECLGQTEVLMPVSPRSFWPEPKVDSSLVHIDLTQPALSLVPDERKRFLKTVAAGFSQKRKQIHNSLSATLGMPSAETKQLLESLGIDPNRRAETLTLTEWHTLSKALQSGV